jgi:hypothetical protein
LELEEYELAIEDQAYPFEEKAIEVHESNLELISRGVYNDWIDRSLQKLAQIVPVRYDKPEESSEVVGSLETYIFALARPAANLPPEMTDSTVADGLKQSGPIGDAGSGQVVQNTERAPFDEAEAVTDTWADQSLPETNTEHVEEVRAAEPDTFDEADTITDAWADKPLPETSTGPEETVRVMVTDSRAETPADLPVPSGFVEAVSEIQAPEPVTTNELVLWVDENPVDESDIQEGSPEVIIP